MVRFSNGFYSFSDSYFKSMRKQDLINYIRTIEKNWENQLITNDIQYNNCMKLLAEERNKAIDEVMEIVKKAYHNFSGYDLEFMTKYGNKNASQQSESYSTLMMYEVAGEFEDLLDNLEQLKGGAE